MMQRASPKNSSGYRSNSSTSSEDTLKGHFFISKKFIAPEPKVFPIPTFGDSRKP
jgi:hypothetical protein